MPRFLKYKQTGHPFLASSIVLNNSLSPRMKQQPSDLGKRRAGQYYSGKALQHHEHGHSSIGTWWIAASICLWLLLSHLSLKPQPPHRVRSWIAVSTSPCRPDLVWHRTVQASQLNLQQKRKCRCQQELDKQKSCLLGILLIVLTKTEMMFMKAQDGETVTIACQCVSTLQETKCCLRFQSCICGA